MWLHYIKPEPMVTLNFFQLNIRAFTSKLNYMIRVYFYHLTNVLYYKKLLDLSLKTTNILS
jgi:hypothetical protein